MFTRNCIQTCPKPIQWYELHLFYLILLQKKVLSRLWFDLLINWIYFLNYIEKQQVNCFATSMLSNKV